MTLDDRVELFLTEAVIGELIRETQSTKDRCVDCKKETEYEKSTPVSQRKFYDREIGPMCEPCYRIHYPERIANGEY